MADANVDLLTPSLPIDLPLLLRLVDVYQESMKTLCRQGSICLSLSALFTYSA